MSEKKDKKPKGLSIDGDVGYSEVRQEFDDHSTNSSNVVNDYSQDDHSHHQSTTVNDSSIHDSSTHNKTTVHDQSTRQFSTKTVTQNDSSVTDHSSHVKTENVFMGDRHNPLVYIFPIVLVAVAAIGAIVLVVNKQQNKPDVQISAVPKPAELATTPSPMPSPPAVPPDIVQTKVTTRVPQPAKLEKFNNILNNNHLTPCDRVNIFEVGQYKGITLSIEKADCFFKIENQFEKPKGGNLFFALLISIQNNGDFKLYGGSSDYHNTFSVVTQDGYEIQALNTSSTAWKENRMVWNSDLIEIGDKRKGWIVFSIPQQSTPEKVLFSVDRWDSPHQLTSMGTLSGVQSH